MSEPALSSSAVALIDDGTIAYVRLLTGDNGDTRILSDEELARLTDKAGGALRGAADALDVIASTEVLLSKKIATQDLQTDGPAVAAELRKQAAALRARAADEAAEQAWGVAVWNFCDRQPEATERPFSW